MEGVLSTQATHRRAIALGGLALAALLMHLVAFSGWRWVWPVPVAAPAVQLRVIEAPALVPAIAQPTAAAPAEPPAVVSAVVPDEPPARVRPPRPSMPKVRPAPPRVPSPSPTPALAEPTPVALGGDELDTIPHYRTEIPPAITLHYQLLRAALRGEGELAWRPSGDGYELRLEGRVAGVAVLTQLSRGGVDAAGIAPERFTDQRLRRGTKAANFQRAAGKITFSGPSVEFPLREGTQDRLSWMIQLAAIVAAEAPLREVGAKVVMPVVGASGELNLWSFVCEGVDSLTLAGSSVGALKFVREPREPYDTQVQVWLDPARHHLPVRATQKSGPNDEGFELRLQSAE